MAQDGTIAMNARLRKILTITLPLGLIALAVLPFESLDGLRAYLVGYAFGFTLGATEHRNS